MSMKMKAPENYGSVSFDGVEYVADENGFVDVSGEAVQTLLQYGYSIVEANTEENKPSKKSKVKE